MAETKTNWEDSGFDCQLCGVIVYKRTDIKKDRSPQTCLQGEHGCQWTLEGKLIRVGSHPDCQRLHEQAEAQEASTPIPNWVWGIVAIIFLFFVFRFGGIVALRFLVPMALGGAALFYFYRFGRERQWW